MNDSVGQLEPRLVWQSFSGLAAIPRPSRHERAVVLHVKQWAGEHGFTIIDDDFGNLAVLVPATEGLEDAPQVILQSHLDMVPEKNSDVDFDFLQDSIRLRVEGDWVTAEGTTLGADNGLGAASAMAVAIDPSVRHGPLCLLFTIQEEIGLQGATALDPGLLRGDLLINLDTEEDDSIYIGCAGAAGTVLEWDFESKQPPNRSELFELAVTGLRGGHSGMDIVEGRGNAIKILARALQTALENDIDFEVVTVNGGDKANAIPRECFATLCCLPEQLEALDSVVRNSIDLARAELGTADPKLTYRISKLGEAESKNKTLASSDRDRLVAFLAAAPHGPLAMSRDVVGLVEVSTNLAVVELTNAHARVALSVRASDPPAFESTRVSIAALGRLAGARMVHDPGYPGWKPNPESELVARAAEVYSELFDSAPGIKAVHAGLECGILVEKAPRLEAISIGPEIRGAHSPDERASISSVQKFYSYLSALLRSLSSS